MSAIDVIWIRLDLRLTDHPALLAGSENTCALIFTGDGVDLGRMGAASRVYLHHALAAFEKDLADHFGARLLIYPTLMEAVSALSSKASIRRVLWNRSYEPRRMEADALIELQLKERGIESVVYPGGVLFEPTAIQNKSGSPFKVFTPFYKTLLAHGVPPKPLPKPKALQTLPLDHRAELSLLPLKPRWDLPMMADWKTSETSIQAQWKDFRQNGVEDYIRARDMPAEFGTSRLSPALHFGQVSPRWLWDEGRKHPGPGMESFLRQLVWREFAIYSLFHQPTMDRLPILEQFQRFPWASEPEHLAAWQQGRTGYPIVDAGMRELWATGSMHNRVRMIVGSFLVKNLHINWIEGAAWFWDTLIDADLANNSMGWQWVAGSGIDPSPYFRIFNPMRQSEKFDPEGVYIKRWIPELDSLNASSIHAPWEATTKLAYPSPIVDFAKSRQLALMFYDRIRSAKG